MTQKKVGFGEELFMAGGTIMLGVLLFSVFAGAVIGILTILTRLTGGFHWWMIPLAPILAGGVLMIVGLIWEGFTK